MKLNNLTAISPIDGRYRKKLARMADFYSELAFMQYKLRVEVEYFIALSEAGVPQLSEISSADCDAMRSWVNAFSEEDGERVKEFESVTNHDVKAIEYFLKEKMTSAGGAIADAIEFVHFGLTSQDINNTAVPMMMQDSIKDVVIPTFRDIIGKLNDHAESWKDIPMLARTHGQPASPTTLSKEIRVFTSRLENQLAELETVSYPGKFGGATGNLNAHYVAYPDRNWQDFATNFLSTLRLKRSYPTTQIDHYDGLAQIFDNIKRLNTVLIDLCADFWLYISREYFIQIAVKDEVGSSAMPHKVNPIDYENAEGNFGMANSVFEFLSRKLPVSRLQRDLTDSTVMRNIGVAMSHTYLALLSLTKGLGKIEVNRAKIADELEDNWAVVAEAIQTILRREGYPNPYEALKDLTRGNHEITKESIHEFIHGLDIDQKIREELLAITPDNYLGSESRPRVRE